MSPPVKVILDRGIVEEYFREKSNASTENLVVSVAVPEASSSSGTTDTSKMSDSSKNNDDSVVFVKEYECDKTIASLRKELAALKKQLTTAKNENYDLKIQVKTLKDVIAGMASAQQPYPRLDENLPLDGSWVEKELEQLEKDTPMNVMQKEMDNYYPSGSENSA